MYDLSGETILWTIANTTKITLSHDCYHLQTTDFSPIFPCCVAVEKDPANNLKGYELHTTLPFQRLYRLDSWWNTLFPNKLFKHCSAKHELYRTKCPPILQVFLLPSMPLIKWPIVQCHFYKLIGLQLNRCITHYTHKISGRQRGGFPQNCLENK